MLNMPRYEKSGLGLCSPCGVISWIRELFGIVGNSDSDIVGKSDPGSGNPIIDVSENMKGNTNLSYEHK